MQNLTDRIAYTTAFVTPVVEHWLEREIAQWVLHAIKTALIYIYIYDSIFGGFFSRPPVEYNGKQTKMCHYQSFPLLSLRIVEPKALDK